MANSDSRHTTPTLRWAETTGEVVSGNAVEPSGGKKNTGFLPGVAGEAVGEWINWLWYAAGAFNRYVERLLAKMFTRNGLMAGASSTEGEVTNGVGLSIDVTAAQVWIDGAMLQVPAVTNLALAAADPTDDRIDLVTAQVVALVPTYVVVTGTPDPAPSAPALPVGAVPIYEVRVNAAAVAPGSKTDRRLFGALNMDLLRANKQLVGGDMGSEFFFLVEDLGSAFSLRIGGDTDPIAQFSDFGPQMLVQAEAFRFFDPIVRHLNLAPAAFQNTATSNASLAGDIAGAVARWAGSATNDAIVASVSIPNGATITGAAAYIDRVTDAEGIRVRLLRSPKTGGALVEIGNAVTPFGSGPTGAMTVSFTGLSVAADDDMFYTLAILWLGAGVDATEVFGGSVAYTEITPFDGI